MNIQAIKNYILDPANANKNDAAILTELQAFPNTLGEVTDREALNYDADYGLRRKLQYAIDNAPNALADGCIIFLNIVINGRLPSVNIADSSTQNVLNGLVQYGTQLAIAGVAAENIYYQADKDALEALAMTPSIYNGVQLSDIAHARLLINPITLQEVTYTQGSVHVVKPSRSEKIRVIITIDPTDVVPYSDNLIVTAYDKNVGESVYIENSIPRGNFLIPANFTGSKVFYINHSNLENHIKLKITSKYNRVFRAKASLV